MQVSRLWADCIPTSPDYKNAFHLYTERCLCSNFHGGNLLQEFRKRCHRIGEKNKTVYAAAIRDTIVGSSNMHLYRHTTFYVLPLSFDYLENINHSGTSQKCAVLFGAGMTFPSTKTKMARFFSLIGTILTITSIISVAKPAARPYHRVAS